MPHGGAVDIFVDRVSASRGELVLVLGALVGGAPSSMGGAVGATPDGELASRLRRAPLQARHFRIEG